LTTIGWPGVAVATKVSAAKSARRGWNVVPSAKQVYSPASGTCNVTRPSVPLMAPSSVSPVNTRITNAVMLATRQPAST
jgi:hypothetical protein